MAGRRSQNKGKRGEREARALLNDVLGRAFRVRERANSGAVGGGGHGDIVISHKTLGDVDLKIEVKRYKQFSDYGILAKDNADILMKRADNEGWLFVLTEDAMRCILEGICAG